MTSLGWIQSFVTNSSSKKTTQWNSKLFPSCLTMKSYW
ncbi:hypothetical protein A1Q_2644 [Vibrio campbellii HY01]|nr:hypothetical protein A1Q_2644 [Vibrio campbellii HY01]